MKVIFQIEGGSPIQIECNAGDNLLELARRANVAIEHSPQRHEAEPPPHPS